MKKNVSKLLILYFIILFDFSFAFAAGVIDTPHDIPSAIASLQASGTCSVCHVPVKGLGYPWDVPNRGTGPEGGVGNKCALCHSSNVYGAAGLIEASYDEKYVFPGIGLGRSSHGLTVTEKYEEGTVSSDLPYAEAFDHLDFDSDINSLQCTTCHNVHDNGTNRPFLRDNIKSLCSRCHTKDDSHPAGIETEIFKKREDSYLTLRPVEGFGFSAFIFRLLPFYSPIGATDGMAPQDGGGVWNLGRHLATDEIVEGKIPGTGLEGNITCVTCHAVHGVQDDSDANNPITLPNKNMLVFP